MTCLCDNSEWYALYEWHFPHILEDFRPIHPITNQMLSLVWATSQATFWVIYYHIVHLGDQMPKLHEGLAWLFPECHRFTPLIIGHHITYIHTHTHIYIYIYIIYIQWKINVRRGKLFHNLLIWKVSHTIDRRTNLIRSKWLFMYYIW